MLIISVAPEFAYVPRDPDFWWHLKTGLDFIQTGHLARTDPYSFTAAGSEWINHEWLADWLLARVWSAWGDPGLWVFRNLIFGGFLLTFFLLLTSTGLSFSSASLLIALLGPWISKYLTLRPQALSYLFLLLFFAILQHTRKNHSPKLLFYLIPLFLLWANLHGGFTLGLLLLNLSSVFAYLERSHSRHTWLLCTVLSAAAALLNPYGIRLYLNLWQHLSIEHVMISEWQPFFKQARWQIAAFYFSLLTMFPAIFLQFAKKRPYKTEIGFWILSAVMTFLHRRFFILLVMSGTIVFAYSAASLGLQKMRSELKSALQILKMGLLLILSLQSLMRLSYVGRHPFQLTDPIPYPKKAVDFLRDQNLGPHLAVTFQWGGYALFHLFPQYQISLDGRNLTVYPAHYVDDQLRAYQRGDLRNFVPENADNIMVEKGSPIHQALTRDRGWTEIYQDRIAVLFKKNL